MVAHANAGGYVPAESGRRVGAYFAQLGINVGLGLVTCGIGPLIWELVAWGNGQNVGHQVLGLTVYDRRSGRPATWGKMFVREFLVKGVIGLLSFGISLLVGAIQLLSGKSPWWDAMLDTTVTTSPVLPVSNSGPSIPQTALAPSPSWSPDPTGRHELRYWSGFAWTEHVSDAGRSDVDSL